MKMVNIFVNGEEVVLDSKNLEFNQATLNKYFEREAAIYSSYSNYLAQADYEFNVSKLYAEEVYAEKFKFHKEGGCSDKMADASASIETDVKEARRLMAECELRVKLLKNYLKSLDNSHENAISYGHMLRKEMDKLGNYIGE